MSLARGRLLLICCHSWACHVVDVNNLLAMSELRRTGPQAKGFDHQESRRRQLNSQGLLLF